MRESRVGSQPRGVDQTPRFDVLPRSGTLQWRLRLVSLHLWAINLRRLWYAALREVGSCVRNIELLRTTELHRRSVLPGPRGWMDKSVLSLEYVHACTEDIQAVKAKYPWASRVELQMIAAAWVQAEKRFRGNLESGTGLQNRPA